MHAVLMFPKRRSGMKRKKSGEKKAGAETEPENKEIQEVLEMVEMLGMQTKPSPSPISNRKGWGKRSMFAPCPMS